MPASPKSSPRVPLLAAAASAVVALGFAAYTGHMWEDFLITFRSSLNLATGHGLVYQWGERVHSFTSPLGTLLPALFARGGEENVAIHALWWFRLTSAAALGAAVWLAFRAMVRERLAPLAVGAAAAAFVLDPKIVDFAMNGMESGWLVFFVIVTWWAFTNGAQLLPCALGFAGLQWTRPDGCVFFGAVAAAWLICAGPPGTTVVARVRVIARAIALGVLFYLPWALFAWWYYGSPIPHTILAKMSHHAPGELAWSLGLYPWRLLFGHAALHEAFMPTYFYLGGWPWGLLWVLRLVTVGAAVAWLVPGLRPAGRVASLAFFLGGFYVEYIPRSPWYFPGWQALALVAWAYLLDAALRRESQTTRAAWAGALVQSTGRIAALVLVLLQASLFVAAAWQMKHQQAIIENGHRREIGRWLHAHAAPGDRVFLEPLGYIGYYSGLKMLDFPGLAAPEVVAVRRAGHRTYAQIIATLRPEWLVLRIDEVRGIQDENPQLLSRDYWVDQVFDTRAQVQAVPFLPGRGYLQFDALFLVFHRVPPASPAS